MKTLEKQYQWLAKESGPKMILEALKLYGTEEKMGTGNNPEILNWAHEIGGNVKRDYFADSVPWCGLFMAIVARRANKDLPNDPLWALNWSTFGRITTTPMLGDVLTFKRTGGGHVALYVGEDRDYYHILGGNQGDKVCIVRKEKRLLYVARRPNYINQPLNIRKIMLKAEGSISTRES